MNVTAARSPTRLPLLLLALALVTMILWAAPGLADVDTTTASHAAEHHGQSDVDLIHKCLDANGSTRTLVNTRTGCWAQCIQLDDTGRSWGIQIVRQIKGYFCEITAFIRNDTWLDDVVQYLVRRGYMEVP